MNFPENKMVYETELKEVPLLKRGKVRDLYDLGKNLLIVATDRISSFDFILPTPIPDKGKILTQISKFWFSFLKEIIPNHLITTDIKNLPDKLKPYKDTLYLRFMVTEKCEVIPFECVVRGYISGSAWKEYQKDKTVCGITLPEGLTESEKLKEPIFTPATKAESGHDENVGFEYMKDKLGHELSERIRTISLKLYKKASEYALTKGIIIADTKFEFGLNKESSLILIDEALTPDSSRFWPKDEYSPGKPQKSFDKQYVRDYLNSLDWEKIYPAPGLPEKIVSMTRKKYLNALKRITGKGLE